MIQWCLGNHMPTVNYTRQFEYTFTLMGVIINKVHVIVIWLPDLWATICNKSLAWPQKWSCSQPLAEHVYQIPQAPGKVWSPFAMIPWVSQNTLPTYQEWPVFWLSELGLQWVGPFWRPSLLARSIILLFPSIFLSSLCFSLVLKNQRMRSLGDVKMESYTLQCQQNHSV